MDIIELNSIDQYAWSELMYISNPKRRYFPNHRRFLGRKMYANNMPSIRESSKDRHIQSEEHHPLFPLPLLVLRVL